MDRTGKVVIGGLLVMASWKLIGPERGQKTWEWFEGALIAYQRNAQAAMPADPQQLAAPVDMALPIEAPQPLKVESTPALSAADLVSIRCGSRAAQSCLPS